MRRYYLAWERDPIGVAETRRITPDRNPVTELREERQQAMKRSWKEVLSFVISTFAAAPGVVVGPEGALEVLVGLDGRVIVLGAEAAGPAGAAQARPQA